MNTYLEILALNLEAFSVLVFRLTSTFNSTYFFLPIHTSWVCVLKVLYKHSFLYLSFIFFNLTSISKDQPK